MVQDVTSALAPALGASVGRLVRPALALLHDEAGFSWTRWEVHPSVLIGCGLLAFGYLLLVGPLRERRAWARKVPTARVASFLAGLAVLFLALNGPLHDLSDRYLFSAHMAQHMLLMMVMPPLLLLGLPDWLVRPALRRGAVRRVARFLTHPAVAYVLYNAVLIGWHFPRAYDLALFNHDLHILQHLSFIAVATLMWWPVVEPSPELTRIGRPVVVLYLFAFGLPMSILSAFITMADGVLYEWYATAPRLFALDALEDQQLGGLIMWVPGMIIYWGAVAAVYLRWAAREEARDGRAPGWAIVPGR